MILQKTLKKPIEIKGKGLHSGQPVTMKLLPAKTNSGVVFVRNDLGNQTLKAGAHRVTDTQLCTVMENESVRVATIEHIMSALAGLGVDNVEIHLDAPEVPIVDGSAAPFVYLIQQAGLVSQDAAKQFILIENEIEVRQGDKWAKFLPFRGGFKLDFCIDFNHPAIRKEDSTASIVLDAVWHEKRYIQSIARARTFGFLHDIEYLRQNNLALGGSLDNAVVLDEFRVLNENGLRYPDELVRHKILDAVGDLYLESKAIIGHYVGYKSGHMLNNQLFRALLASDNYRITTLEREEMVIEEGKLESSYLF